MPKPQDNAYCKGEKRQGRLKEPTNNHQLLVLRSKLVAQGACLSPKNIQVGLSMVISSLGSGRVLLSLACKGGVEEGIVLEHPGTDSSCELLDLLLNVGEDGV